MPWKNLNDDEQELYFISEAITDSDIANDIEEVVKRMVEYRDNHNVIQNTLFFDINATNSLIRIYWYNSQAQIADGMYYYTLMLEKLGIKTLEVCGGGAFQFDTVCKMGIWDYTEANCYTAEGDIIYRVFRKTEMNDEAEELII